MLKSGRRHTRWNCDWSSDVCSSDLYSYTLSATIDNDSKVPTGNDTVDATGFNDSVALTVHGVGGTSASDKIGRASCRERVKVAVVGVCVKKENGIGTVGEDGRRTKS